MFPRGDRLLLLQKRGFSPVSPVWLWVLGLLGLLLLFLAPLFLSEFRLNLLGKFLAYAILALGIDLIWGYAGILSLGHGIFFGLGAYCMAMYLKLEATPKGLPDFMSWSGVSQLPWFWVPFHNIGFAVVMAVALPMAVAAVLGYLTFHNRIKGVHFSILSQALVVITVTLFIGQQGLTGGTNGITNFQTILGFPLKEASTQLVIYYATLGALIVAFMLCWRLTRSRFGKVLVAIRDGENRVRFSGFNPASYKLFAYALSAGLAGLAGMFFVMQVGIISPAMMGIVPSIEMVLWVALGGRGTLIGAVLGALLTNSAKTAFSESFPDMWLYFLGGTFVVLVLFLPDGIVGLFRRMWKKLANWRERRVTGSSTAETEGFASAEIPLAVPRDHR